MTTFQGIVYGIIHGFAEFLPVGAGAHHSAVAYFLGWPVPDDIFLGALSAGAFLALVVYFIHDWASIISSLIQVIIFRKKPMTLDERMPFFMFLAGMPAAIAWYYLGEKTALLSENLLLTSALLIVFCIPLWLADSMSRRTKGMFDLNWLDSVLTGIGQSLFLLGGCGRAAGALSVAMLRNFNRETATKFTFLFAAPVIAGSVFKHLHIINWNAAQPMHGMSWLTFIVTVIITMLASLLAIDGFMKQSQRKGFGRYIAYRCTLAIAIFVVHWVKSGSPL